MKKGRITLYPVETKTAISVPFADQGIRAGFPSPAQDYIDIAIDLNRELIKNPESTFLARVDGNSMTDAHIDDMDILVIDKSLDLRDGDIAVCFIDGEFTVKYVNVNKGKKEIRLVPANPEYSPILITPENEFIIWGVVTYIVKKARK
jgi:putative error-prone repair: SOS-response transcriptional repressor umuD homolog